MLHRMKTLLCGLFALIPGITSGSALAEEVRYEFSGYVSDVSDTQDQLPDEISYLSTFTGSFTYDDTVSGKKVGSNTPGTSYSDYQAGHIEFLIDGTYLFRMDMLDTVLNDAALIVRDGTGSDGFSDQFKYSCSFDDYSQPSPTHPDLFTRSLIINLEDSDNKDAITGEELQDLELDLSSFSWFRMGIAGNNNGTLHQDFRIGGFITSLQLVTNHDPVAHAGADQTVDCDGPDGTVVMLDASDSFDPDGDSLTYEWSVPAGTVLDDATSPTPLVQFPIGITTATLTVTDGNGGLDVDDVMITIVDQTPPEVSCSTSVAAIWPPNHKFVPVMIYIDATDHCTAPEDLILGFVTIESNEPDDAEGLGDGETTGDVDGQDGFTTPVDVTDLLTYNPDTASFEGLVYLRAERDAEGFGRSYSINAIVLDSFNNIANTSRVVIVPHDRRKNHK